MSGFYVTPAPGKPRRRCPGAKHFFYSLKGLRVKLAVHVSLDYTVAVEISHYASGRRLLHVWRHPDIPGTAICDFPAFWVAAALHTLDAAVARLGADKVLTTLLALELDPDN